MPEKSRLCDRCPELIEKVTVAAEAAKHQRESLDSLAKLQQEALLINREDHKAFRESISDLTGWRKSIIGISVGVSSVVSAAVVILGFVIKVGAWPVPIYTEAEAARPKDTGKAITNIVESAKLLDVLPSVKDDEEEEEHDEIYTSAP